MVGKKTIRKKVLHAPLMFRLIELALFQLILLVLRGTLCIKEAHAIESDVEPSLSVFTRSVDSAPNESIALSTTSTSAPYSRVRVASPETNAFSANLAEIVAPPSVAGVYLRIEKLSAEEAIEKF